MRNNCDLKGIMLSEEPAIRDHRLYDIPQRNVRNRLVHQDRKQTRPPRESEWLVSEYGLSPQGDENVLEPQRGDGCRTRNIPKAPESHTLERFIYVV